jgi:hypothetical protein
MFVYNDKTEVLPTDGNLHIPVSGNHFGGKLRWLRQKHLRKPKAFRRTSQRWTLALDGWRQKRIQIKFR